MVFSIIYHPALPVLFGGLAQLDARSPRAGTEKGGEPDEKPHLDNTYSNSQDKEKKKQQPKRIL